APPGPGACRRLASELRLAARRHRVALSAGSAAWLVALVLLNLGAATPKGTYARDLLAGLAAVGVAAALAWVAVRSTRLREFGGLLLLAAGAYLAGVI